MSKLTDLLRALGVLALILLAYGIAGRLDFDEELRQDAERAQAAEQRVLDCLNGKPLGYYERATRKGRNDFGRTYIVCRTEEIEV